MKNRFIWDDEDIEQILDVFDDDIEKASPPRQKVPINIKARLMRIAQNNNQ